LGMMKAHGVKTAVVKLSFVKSKKFN